MARPNRTGLSPEGVRELIRRGLSLVAIAEMHNCSVAYVSKLKKQGSTSDSVLTPREKALRHYPWRTDERLSQSSINKAMRDHFEYMTTGGKGMPDWKLKRLQSFYEKLIEEKLVVEFDPQIPPGPGNKTGGFAYRKREARDTDLIIRDNDHTHISKEARQSYLRLPPRLPQEIGN